MVEIKVSTKTVGINEYLPVCRRCGSKISVGGEYLSFEFTKKRDFILCLHHPIDVPFKNWMMRWLKVKDITFKLEVSDG
jgi:hypothetical protein